MKKKYILLVLIVFICQAFVSNFSYVKAEANTAICSGPSETMSLYFDFQNEMISALLGSEINERRFSAHVWTGGLFSQQVVILTKDTAIDLLANSLWNRARSVVSTATTSVVLISLSTISIAQSSTEWLAILFRDRPIVRDYKTMMDIETDLFDVAYFLSKQVNITRPVDWKMHDNIRLVIEKYQDFWLLDWDTVELNNNVSIADVLWDLVWMNAAMKHFITYDSGLKTYHWCMNRSQGKNCTAVLKFSGETIEQLKFDYKWTFGKCNSNFKSSMSKIGSSFLDEQKSWWQDVKDAMGRLKSALVEWWKWPRKKNRACDISDYEMSQIRAYRWNDWTCGEAAKLYASIPDVKVKRTKWELRKREKLSKEQKEQNKKAREQKKKDRQDQRQQNKIDRQKQKEQKKESIEQQRWEWISIYWTGTTYNPEYSLEIEEDFYLDYGSIMEEIDQSMWDVESSDLSSELIKIKALIDQIDSVEKQSKNLKDSLKKVADYQCAG